MDTESDAETAKEEALSFDAAARFLGIDRRALRRLVRQGEIEGRRVRWRRQFRTSDLRAYAERSTEETEPASIMGDVGKMIAELGPPPKDEADGTVAAEAHPLIRMANAIIVQAVSSGASDIHLEPDRRSMRVRYRIDGILHEAMNIPPHIAEPLISRFKVMARIPMTGGRIGQEGDIPIAYQGKDYTLRVSSLSSLYGDTVVAHILDMLSVRRGLNWLGFPPDVQVQLEELILQPSGLFLVAGPMGSGRTTTLCSIVNKISSVEKKIFTVEDPIEYPIGGITHVGVTRKAGRDVGDAVRAILRQDPDVILIGDLRDAAAARAAIEAAVTGPLVLAALPAQDAVSPLTRLANLGIEPALIAESVTGVLAQRLVRKICTNCKEPYRANAEELRRFGFVPDDPGQEVTLFRGKGCEMCWKTGYRGRMGLFELMRVNEEIAELTVQRKQYAEIIDAALLNGMKVLREDGLQKVLEGITTREELLRVLKPSLLKPYF